MKTKKIPMRRCIGCMESKPKNQLIRIVAKAEGGVMIDRTGKANGRGVYLCPGTQCFATAKKKRAIPRGLETEVTEQQLEELLEELNQYEVKNP